jgi:uncharacterized protein (AIM24 family)
VAAVPEQYRCEYCRLESDGAAVNCPHCGAPVNVRIRVSDSGWVEQPAIRDMTRIRFGHSSCQISGSFVAVAEMNLDQADSLYFVHHGLLHANPGIDLDLMRMPDGWQRQLAGLPVYVMTARGPGHLAISANEPGSTIAVPLMPGRSVDVVEHRFLAATGNVAYDWRPSGVWFRTKSGDEVYHYHPLGGAYIDRFTAQDTPGLLLLHAPGSTFIRDLAAGEVIYIKPWALVWKDQSVTASLHSEKMRDYTGYFMWVKLQGPGRAVIKSIFGYAGWRGTIVASSPRTSHAW